MTIQRWLAETHTGNVGSLDWDQVSVRLSRDYVLNERDRFRRDSAKARHELYISAGDNAQADMIGRVFKDPAIVQKRKDWVSTAKYNNLSRRLVNELATVYSVPANRTVSGSKENERYQDLQRACRQHERARQINRWGILHRNLAVGFRVREDTTGERVPVIDIVAPDAFFAVGSPADPTKLIALGFELASSSTVGPHWEVWTDHERFFLDSNGIVIKDTIEAHGMARMPWLLFSIEPPMGKLLDSDTGKDIMAAHQAVWFLNVCHLKEAKSATKQAVIAGDMTTMARNQALDSEMPIEAPDGVVVNTVDFSMDLGMFRESAQYIYETVAGNYGISPGLLKHQGVQSAEARELMRAPLKELRREQQIYFRAFERELAEVQSMVVNAELEQFAFSTRGWSIDFGESRTSLDPKKELEVFEHARRLGLTDTAEELMRRNPDLTVTGAFDELERHVEVETLRNQMMRPIQAMSGSLGAPMVTEPNPTTGETVETSGDAGLRAIEGGN